MTRRLGLTLILLLAPALLVAEKDRPPTRRGFNLMARPLGAITINRVYCGVTNIGEICADSTNSSTIGGGFWPKGSRNQYVFNSGPQIAGIIGSDGGPWANDTTGAFFFDAKGTTPHGRGVTDIFNAASAADRSTWPAAARVPAGSPYPVTRRDSMSASEGDLWWLMWDGDPTLLAGRPHPLGVAVEMRVLGWNYPSGNEDIVYIVQTYYNITSLDPADYAGVRPELRPTLLDLANRFHSLNNEHFGITLPQGGYTMGPLYYDFASDFDVADAGQNYSTANIPFSLGYSYEHSFSAFQGWAFDPQIFSPPFFPGSGLVGITFLEGQNGVNTLHLFSGTSGGGSFSDPRDVRQLYRYMSGTLSSVYGDGACNFNPLTQRLCFIRQSSPSDTRFFQSSGLPDLAPGEFETRVVAYVFAAPVRTGGSAVAFDIKPGAPNIIAGLSDPAIVAAGVNPIDSITGFISASDLSGDGVLQKDEFVTVPRSLLGKTQVAQALFDNQFQLPEAPAAPEFFLIPGDSKVTVIWRPSTSEQTADPFFNIAQDAMRMNPSGTLVPNPLYDPNYRQFDVEGYRVYRGRTNDPGALQLLAQFDYTGTVIQDYAGQVNPTRSCAPELGVTSQCPVAFDPVAPGLTRVVRVDVPLVAPIEQVRLGDRILLTDGTAFSLRSDTTPSSVQGYPYTLIDNGVPFAYEDNTVRNNFRYFYAVTAFDVNSWQSGPASFESSRVLKTVTPVRPATNYVNTAALSTAVFGRGVRLTDDIVPVLDPATGRFSKAMPSSNGWSLQLAAFVKEVFAAPGTIAIRLDSLDLGDAYGSSTVCTDPLPVTYYATILANIDTTALTIPIVQSCFQNQSSSRHPFTAFQVDPGLASRFGGNGIYTFDAQLDVTLEGNYYTNAFGRGCVNGAPGFNFSNTPQTGCDYNGARWFDGPSPTRNETEAHPNRCSTQNNTFNFVTCYDNAGFLTGVETIHEAKSYHTTPNVWRNVEGVLGGAVRGADYNVYWGAGGIIDSVIDVSHNVAVPFDANRLGASWGVLNQSAAQPFAGSYDNRSELTINDIGCVDPLKSFPAPQGQLGCAAGPTYALAQRVMPGVIVLWSGVTTNARNTCTPGLSGCGRVGADNGFVMYLPGHIFLFELTSGQVPRQGTVWSMRDYIGAIRGGGDACAVCTAGADGSYAFVPRTRTMAAVGTELRFTYDVINQVNAPTTRDLSAVHTVPDPYYLTNAFEGDAGGQTIKFVNLPQDAVIRIYSSSGVLVTLLEHHSTIFGGALDWNVRNRTGRRVSSGVYFYHLEAGNARRVGRFTIVNDRPGF